MCVARSSLSVVFLLLRCLCCWHSERSSLVLGVGEMLVFTPPVILPSLFFFWSLCRHACECMHPYFSKFFIFCFLNNLSREQEIHRADHSTLYIESQELLKEGKRKKNAKMERGLFLLPPPPLLLLLPSPHLPFFLLSLSISKLFNKLSAENIRLPTHRCNLAFDLGMSPSGWQEEFLPHYRSEISKMLSVELNHWALGDDSQVAKSGIFLLNMITTVG